MMQNAGTKPTKVEKGRRGEDIAAQFLAERGMRVIAKNFRCPLGEIDLIGRDANTLVFVEVRSRAGKTYGPPQESVTRTKQRRLTRLAQWYIMKNRLERQPARFDVIAITWKKEGEPEITWITNAFEACE